MSRFLITGGSQGIGAAIVAHARNAGHDVVFTGRKQEAIDELSRKTGAHGIAADVSNDTDNARAVEFCRQQMGGVDVLVNNAGVGYIADLGSIDLAPSLGRTRGVVSFTSTTATIRAWLRSTSASIQ